MRSQPTLGGCWMRRAALRSDTVPTLLMPNDFSCRPPPGPPPPRRPKLMPLERRRLGVSSAVGVVVPPSSEPWSSPAAAEACWTTVPSSFIERPIISPLSRHRAPTKLRKAPSSSSLLTSKSSAMAC